MFLEGVIKSYNTERGFGFISIDGEKKDIFFHIQDMPNKNIEPKVGEKLKFLIVEDQSKFKAANIVRLDLKTARSVKALAPNDSILEPQASPQYKAQNSMKTKILMGISVLVIMVLSVLVYGKYQTYQQYKQFKTQQLIEEQQRIVQNQRDALGDLPDRVLSEQGKQNLDTASALELRKETVNVMPPQSHKTAAQPANTPQTCDGREHCSQMRSYDEAVFFNRYCPNTKMDGDGDGIPCEKQFGRR